MYDKLGDIMNYEIDNAIKAVEKTIAQLKSAGAKAKGMQKRSIERNLGEIKVADMENILINLKSHALYITHPQFAKYFE